MSGTNGNGTGNRRSQRDQLDAEFEAATQGRPFAKSFLDELETTMRDDQNEAVERVMAWVKWSAWARFRLYCVQSRDDDNPAIQADCARELGLHKSIVSRLFSYKERRGYLRIEGKKTYPVISPELKPVQKVAYSATFSEFLDVLKVAHSATFEEWQAREEAAKVATAAAKSARKVVFSAFRDWRRAQQTGAHPYKTSSDPSDHKGSSSSSGFPAVEDATTTNPHSSDGPETQPRNGAGTAVALAVEPVEAAAVAEALSRYVRTDDPAIESLIADCRKNAPDCTTEEIVGFIEEKAPLAAGKRNELGFLLTAVPRCFEGGSFRATRGQPKPIPPKPDSPAIRLMKQRIARGERPW